MKKAFTRVKFNFFLSLFVCAFLQVVTGALDSAGAWLCFGEDNHFAIEMPRSALPAENALFFSGSGREACNKCVTDVPLYIRASGIKNFSQLFQVERIQNPGLRDMKQLPREDDKKKTFEPILINPENFFTPSILLTVQLIN